MRHFLDQERSEFALQQVQAASLHAKKETAAELAALPGKLRINGLLTTVFYLEEKHPTVYHALASWLTDPGSPLLWPARRDPSLKVALTQCDAALYAAAVEESIAFAIWLKQWSRALAKSKPAGGSTSDAQATE